jgi:hypothetical protein
VGTASNRSSRATSSGWCPMRLRERASLRTKGDVQRPSFGSCYPEPRTSPPKTRGFRACPGRGAYRIHTN